jgi:hypothetical protein
MNDMTEACLIDSEFRTLAETQVVKRLLMYLKIKQGTILIPSSLLVRLHLYHDTSPEFDSFLYITQATSFCFVLDILFKLQRIR